MDKYHTALKIAPDYPDAHYNLGNLLLREGCVDAAIIHFYQILQTHPNSFDAHGDLGIAFSKKDKLIMLSLNTTTLYKSILRVLRLTTISVIFYCAKERLMRLLSSIRRLWKSILLSQKFTTILVQLFSKMDNLPMQLFSFKRW